MMHSLQILLCAGAVAGTWAWEFTKPDDFETTIGTNEQTLVAFVRPELEKCIALEPEWAMAAESQAGLIAIDCAAEATFCDEQEVLSHPAIRAYFPDNTIERYRGPRKAASILSFLNRIHRPVAELTPSNLTSFLASDDVVIVAHVRPHDGELVERFEAVGHKYRDRFSFGVQTDTEGTVGLRCQNNADRLEFSTAELGHVESVENFVVGCGVKLIGEMTRRNEIKYMRVGKSMVIYFTDSDQDREAYVAAMRPLAKQFKEYLVFVTVDSDEYPEMVATVGHAPGATRVLALQNPHNWQVFPFEGSVNPASVEMWIMDISQGNTKPWDRTSPPVKARKEAKKGAKEVGEEKKEESDLHDEL